MRRHPRRGEAGREVSAPAPAPTERSAELGRRIGVPLVHGFYRPRVLGAWRVPARGPLIFAVNHSHFVDGPMLLGASPRPVHFLIKKEMFGGPLGSFLDAIGQLSVDRDSVDRAAIMRALGVLDNGGVLGIFPEGTRGEGDFSSLRAGLAYFAVRSGAPIVPVAVLGSAEGRSRLIPAWPPLRSRIDLVFGEPFEAQEASGGPGETRGRRTRKALDEATVRIQERLAAHLENARRLTGR
ncbi:lysophospholipid acyltransferase family protein [Streptomyces physcomitrii]|uniref:1-acyl-sn-glycerol-3-phosphate acyltransferase n=1 Tax=Streptomyces physcomitrii TaxID=2724184 RepID=A0ABX1H832_9ACTN|nr:lysophospholipid acyltransferase family protein [Streptomyces physcomitrii]NKI43399.1 1-acyl-sn-glycerol-3-phosphate acyltransferase [Streptomyces physcomitrii]